MCQVLQLLKMGFDSFLLFLLHGLAQFGGSDAASSVTPMIVFETQ
jgi:hypothetical protein